MMMTSQLTLMVAAWAMLTAPRLCRVVLDKVTGDSVQQGAPMMVISQLTLMLAAWAMHIAQPMMMAHTHRAIRETITSLPPNACTCQECNQLALLIQPYAFNINIRWQELRAHPMMMAHMHTADIVTNFQSDACNAKSTPVNRAPPSKVRPGLKSKL